jgi:hypothetical protein
VKKRVVSWLLAAAAAAMPAWSVPSPGPMPVPQAVPIAATAATSAACCSSGSHTGHLMCLHRAELERMRQAVRRAATPQLVTAGGESDVSKRPKPPKT